MTLQVAATTFLVGISFKSQDFVKFQRSNLLLFLFIMISGMIAQCCIICSKDLGRRVPLNYLLLGFVTFCQSYVVTFVCSRYTASSVLMVATITLSAFIGLSFYALTTKHDLTIFHSLAFGISFMMFTMFFIMLFFAPPWMMMVYSFLGVVASLLFIIVDTQTILKSKKYGITYDDYIKASLVLYLDIINLFLNLLKLLGSNDD